MVLNHAFKIGYQERRKKKIQNIKKIGKKSNKWIRRRCDMAELLLCRVVQCEHDKNFETEHRRGKN